MRVVGGWVEGVAWRSGWMWVLDGGVVSVGRKGKGWMVGVELVEDLLVESVGDVGGRVQGCVVSGGGMRVVR